LGKFYFSRVDLFSGRNVLRIDGSNGPEEIQFLSESELPSNAKQHDPTEQKP
jgi:hypothetical protein